VRETHEIINKAYKITHILWRSFRKSVHCTDLDNMAYVNLPQSVTGRAEVDVEHLDSSQRSHAALGRSPTSRCPLGRRRHRRAGDGQQQQPDGHERRRAEHLRSVTLERSQSTIDYGDVDRNIVIS